MDILGSNFAQFFEDDAHQIINSRIDNKFGICMNLFLFLGTRNYSLLSEEQKDRSKVENMELNK